MGLPALLGLLGLLLAGYTVFTNVARRDLLVTMSKVIEAKSGLTWLKVSLYTYVGALAELLVVAALLLAAWILASEGGLVSELVDLDTTGCAEWIVGRTGFVLTAYLFVHTIIVLKVTIRNVHSCNSVGCREPRVTSDASNGRAKLEAVRTFGRLAPPFLTGSD
ncbi:MAG: hypothetical protein AAFP04_16240 [Myxococcota bacterium]